MHVRDNSDGLLRCLARHRRSAVAIMVGVCALLAAGAVAASLGRPLVVALIAGVGIVATALGVLIGTAYATRTRAGTTAEQSSASRPEPRSATGRAWPPPHGALRPALPTVHPSSR